MYTKDKQLIGQILAGLLANPNILTAPEAKRILDGGTFVDGKIVAIADMLADSTCEQLNR